MPFELGRPAAPPPRMPKDRIISERRDVTEEPVGNVGEVARKNLLDGGDYEAVVGSIEKVLAMCNKASGEEAKNKAGIAELRDRIAKDWSVDPTSIPRAEKALAKAKADKAFLIPHVFDRAITKRDRLHERQIKHQIETGKPILRTEYLLARVFAEIPQLGASRTRRAELERELSPLREAAWELRGSKDTRTTNIERQRRPLENELLRLNHESSAWQIHLCELIDKLETMELKGLTDGRNLAEETSTKLWQSMQDYYGLTDPNNAEDIVKSYKTGIVGLRALTVYMRQKGIEVFYPKVTELPGSGGFQCKMDAECAVDICFVSPDRSTIVVAQVKSHTRDMDAKLSKQSIIRPGTSVDFAPVDDELMNDVPKRDKRLYSMQRIKDFSTNPNNYGIYTSAKLLPCWIEFFGARSGGGINPNSGFPDNLPESFDQDTRNLAAFILAALEKGAFDA